jgi:hypothetical protein
MKMLAESLFNFSLPLRGSEMEQKKESTLKRPLVRGPDTFPSYSFIYKRTTSCVSRFFSVLLFGKVFCDAVRNSTSHFNADPDRNPKPEPVQVNN